MLLVIGLFLAVVELCGDMNVGLLHPVAIGYNDCEYLKPINGCIEENDSFLHYTRHVTDYICLLLLDIIHFLVQKAIFKNLHILLPAVY